MSCPFDICEFYNIIFGGTVIGIIASFLFVWLTRWIDTRRFRTKYGHLQSRPMTEFDWTAYSMKKEDGRIRENTPNGSLLNINVKGDKVDLILKQPDQERWVGELRFEKFGFGTVSLKYENRHEYGRRECVLGSFVEDGVTFDYLFLTHVNNRIYYIERQDEKKQTVTYIYGDELFIRSRASR